MEDGYEKDLWLNTMKDLIKDNKVFPCASGSALQDIGVVEFLDKFHQLTETHYTSDEAFSGRVYKVRHDEKGTRITFIKSLSGNLSVRDEINYGAKDQVINGKNHTNTGV